MGGRLLTRIQGLFHGRFDAHLAAETMSVDAVRCLIYQQRLISLTQHVTQCNLHQWWVLWTAVVDVIDCTTGRPTKRHLGLFNTLATYAERRGADASCQ